MGHRDAELGRVDGGGHGRVHIAHDDHEVRAIRHHDLFELDQEPTGLFSMAAGADAEIDIGLGEAQFFEEHFGHRAIIMLAGVYQHREQSGGGLHALVDGGDLHEVGSRPDDVEDLLHNLA